MMRSVVIVLVVVALLGLVTPTVSVNTVYNGTFNVLLQGITLVNQGDTAMIMYTIPRPYPALNFNTFVCRGPLFVNIAYNTGNGNNVLTTQNWNASTPRDYLTSSLPANNNTGSAYTFNITVTATGATHSNTNYAALFDFILSDTSGGNSRPASPTLTPSVSYINDNKYVRANISLGSGLAVGNSYLLRGYVGSIAQFTPAEGYTTGYCSYITWTVPLDSFTTNYTVLSSASSSDIIVVIDTPNNDTTYNFVALVSNPGFDFNNSSPIFSYPNVPTTTTGFTSTGTGTGSASNLKSFLSWF